MLLHEDCDGSSIVVPAVTEIRRRTGSGSGRDASVENSGGYVMNGTKRFVSTPKPPRTFFARRTEEGKVVFLPSTPKVPA